MAPFGSSGMVSYSTSIATMAVSRTVSEIHRLIGQKLLIFFTPPPCIRRPVRSEAIRVKQRPSVTKTKMMGYHVVKEFRRNV